MAPPKSQKEKADSGETATTAAPREAETRPITSSVVQSYDEWLRERNNAFREWQGRTMDAQLDLAGAMHTAQAEAWQPVREAQRKLAQHAGRACVDTDARTAYFEAYGALLAAQQAFWSSQAVRDRWVEASRACQEAQEEATKGAEERRRQADVSYAARLKEAVAEVDPKTVDEATLRWIHWATAVISWR